jgi:excisionase family DNA binding protein
MNSGETHATRLAPGIPNPVSCPPRLLDLDAAAAYLSVSAWTIRDLIANGTLTRVRVPLPNGGELRRVLLDREDLDRLVVTWKS